MKNLNFMSPMSVAPLSTKETMKALFVGTNRDNQSRKFPKLVRKRLMWGSLNMLFQFIAWNHNENRMLHDGKIFLLKIMYGNAIKKIFGHKNGAIEYSWMSTWFKKNVIKLENPTKMLSGHEISKLWILWNPTIFINIDVWLIHLKLFE